MSVQTELLERKGSANPTKSVAKVEEIVGEGFSVEKFAEHFGDLVEVAGSTKLLKELVLELAVRGRLTEPADASAPLLTELARRRAAIAVKGVRVGGPSVKVAEDEVPYRLPDGWSWVRLRDLGGFAGGATPSKANSSFWEGPIPWVSPKDMKRPYIDDAEDHISMAAVEGSSVKLIPTESILFVVRGMILAHSFPVALTTCEVTINQDMRALVLAVPEMREFVLRSLWAARKRVLALVERSSHGTCRLDSDAVENLPIALPPLAEQKRIVAKVDQLMALCDELEARQTGKRETGARLTKSALEALTTAEGPEKFDAAYLRVLEHFDVLFGTASDIAGLRCAVIDIAIHGRLVSHEPTDGVAPSFAEAHREPYPLPVGWRWSSLENIASHFVDCLHSTPKYVATGYPAIRTADLVPGRILLEQTRRIGEEDFAERTRRLVPEEGDIFYSREGERLGIAACVPAGVRVCVSQRTMHLRVRSPMVPEYVMWAMNSRFVYAQAVADTGGSTSPHVNMKAIRRFLLPVPPIPQQYRIVAKIERLLARCDDLEARLRRAEDRAAKLVEAVVQELVA